MEKTSFSQSLIFRKSWNFMKKQGVTMVGLYLTFILVSVILSFVSGSDILSVRYILGNLLTFVISWGFGMGFSKLILNILDGIEPKVNVFLSVWSRAWNYLMQEIIILFIIGIYSVISYMAATSFYMTIFPLVYLFIGVLFFFLVFILIRISFTGLIILDTDLNCAEALKRSWKITKGYVWKLIFMYFSIVLLNVLGLIVFIIGIFFTLPMSQFIYTIAYRMLSDIYQEKEETEFINSTDEDSSAISLNNE